MFFGSPNNSHVHGSPFSIKVPLCFQVRSTTHTPPHARSSSSRTTTQPTWARFQNFSCTLSHALLPCTVCFPAGVPPRGHSSLPQDNGSQTSDTSPSPESVKNTYSYTLPTSVTLSPGWGPSPTSSQPCSVTFSQIPSRPRASQSYFQPSLYMAGSPIPQQADDALG